MISNRDLVEKTKPILKDSYFQVFICIVLASILPQIISSVSPQNLYLNIGVVWLSGYIQLGIAVFCLDVLKITEQLDSCLINEAEQILFKDNKFPLTDNWPIVTN